MYRRACIFVCAGAIAASALAVGAFAGDGSVGQEVRVAQGKFAGRYWSLKVQGRHHRRCYELSLRGKSIVQTGGTCDPGRHRPALWSRVMGIGDQNDSATVELNVTRTRVRQMRLRIGHPRTDRPPRWMRVRTRRITRPEARKAKLRRNFRFAVLHSRGTLCVKRVILFDRKGDRIEDKRVPCEG